MTNMPNILHIRNSARVRRTMLHVTGHQMQGCCNAPSARRIHIFMFGSIKRSATSSKCLCIIKKLRLLPFLSNTRAMGEVNFALRYKPAKIYHR